ncbi:hypothetical protein DITRI_Ditri18aG0041400 [Diplodiscus trichospermus]
MGCMSTAAHVGGSQVLGIIPTTIVERSIAGKTVGEEHRVPTMQDRIWKMLDNSDAFIALPGSAREENFIPHSARQIFISASTAKELIDKLEDFVYEPNAIVAQINWSKGSNNKKHKLHLSLHL